jgi:hypothetical protein
MFISKEKPNGRFGLKAHCLYANTGSEFFYWLILKNKHIVKVNKSYKV